MKLASYTCGFLGGTLATTFIGGISMLVLSVATAPKDTSNQLVGKTEISRNVCQFEYMDRFGNLTENTGSCI